MKVLLREYDYQPYVWMDATYNGEYFVVEDCNIDEYQIISVMNDNRKNYVRCSSCGKMFTRNGKKFAKHKRDAETIKPCLECRKMRSRERDGGRIKYTVDKNGNYVRKITNKVDLICHYSTWNDFHIDSRTAIETCKFRRCKDAGTEEIEDTFTKYPGLFDDIITVDAILDNGYKELLYRNPEEAVYFLDEKLNITAKTNRIGIVTSFNVGDDSGFYSQEVFYSKKYDMLMWIFDCRYTQFNPDWLTEERMAEVKKYIAKLYK